MPVEVEVGPFARLLLLAITSGVGGADLLELEDDVLNSSGGESTPVADHQSRGLGRGQEWRTDSGVCFVDFLGCDLKAFWTATSSYRVGRTDPGGIVARPNHHDVVELSLKEREGRNDLRLDLLRRLTLILGVCLGHERGDARRSWPVDGRFTPGLRFLGRTIPSTTALGG